MTPDHFSLNIAYNGSHWARVNFELDSEDSAKFKAKQIARALSDSYGTPKKWSFALVRVEIMTRGVEMIT